MNFKITNVRKHIDLLAERIKEGFESIENVKNNPDIEHGKVLHFVESTMRQIDQMISTQKKLIYIDRKYPDSEMFGDREFRFISWGANQIADKAEFNPRGFSLMGVTVWPYHEEIDGTRIYHNHGPFAIGELKVGSGYVPVDKWEDSLKQYEVHDRVIESAKELFKESADDAFAVELAKYMDRCDTVTIVLGDYNVSEFHVGEREKSPFRDILAHVSCSDDEDGNARFAGYRGLQLGYEVDLRGIGLECSKVRIRRSWMIHSFGKRCLTEKAERLVESAIFREFKEFDFFPENGKTEEKGS